MNVLKIIRKSAVALLEHHRFTMDSKETVMVQVIDVLSLGQRGFDRITAGNNKTGTWVAFKVVNGYVTLDTGCTTAEGDAPAEDDVLLQGDAIPGNYTKLAVKAGSPGEIWAFRK